jgi:type III secretion protein W
MDAALAGRTDPEAVALRQAVQARIAANNRESAPAIQAGLNVTQTAMLEASDAGEVQDLRNFYRESVLSHESLGKSWANIVERYGDGDLGGRIRFLLNALGADLASRGPSIPPAELKAILDETHQLATLSTMRERAGEFFKRLHARFGRGGCQGQGGRG